MYPEQRSEYRTQFLPEVDHRLAVWQAYLNVLNSFQGLEMTSTQAAGAGVMRASTESRVSETRFIYNLGILDGLLDEDKTEDTEWGQREQKKLTDLMRAEKTDFPDFLDYWTEIDKLMRRQQFYTTSKLPSGHL